MFSQELPRFGVVSVLAGESRPRPLMPLSKVYVKLGFIRCELGIHFIVIDLLLLFSGVKDED